MRVLFNTRAPFRTTLPMLPRRKGDAAAPAVAVGHSAPLATRLRCAYASEKVVQTS
jgi:hypothetical protein